jgi:DNA-binding Xre family transcriptional regulator
MEPLIEYSYAEAKNPAEAFKLIIAEIDKAESLVALEKSKNLAHKKLQSNFKALFAGYNADRIKSGQKKLTLVQFAALAEVSHTTITRLNTGKFVRLKNQTVERVCHALDCEIGDLISLVTRH